MDGFGRFLVHEDSVAIRIFKDHPCAIRTNLGFAVKFHAQPFHSLVVTKAIFGFNREVWVAAALLAQQRLVLLASRQVQRDHAALVSGQCQRHPLLIAYRIIFQDDESQLFRLEINGFVIVSHQHTEHQFVFHNVFSIV